MKWPWPPPRLGDIIAIALAIVFLGALVLSVVYPISLQRKNETPLGPDWDCKDLPYANVCIKKIGSK